MNNIFLLLLTGTDTLKTLGNTLSAEDYNDMKLLLILMVVCVLALGALIIGKNIWTMIRGR
ncbi:MAG: hypothetical protein ACPGXL_04795 [Chitinophagales bacterium]